MELPKASKNAILRRLYPGLLEQNEYAPWITRDTYGPKYIPRPFPRTRSILQDSQLSNLLENNTEDQTATRSDSNEPTTPLFLNIPASVALYNSQKFDLILESLQDPIVEPSIWKPTPEYNYYIPQENAVRKSPSVPGLSTFFGEFFDCPIPPPSPLILAACSLSPPAHNLEGFSDHTYCRHDTN